MSIVTVPGVFFGVKYEDYLILDEIFTLGNVQGAGVSWLYGFACLGPFSVFCVGDCVLDYQESGSAFDV